MRIKTVNEIYLQFHEYGTDTLNDQQQMVLESAYLPSITTRNAVFMARGIGLMVDVNVYLQNRVIKPSDAGKPVTKVMIAPNPSQSGFIIIFGLK